jgi:hypothetical protein
MTEVRWGLKGVDRDFPPITISFSIDCIFQEVENPHSPPPTPTPTVRRGERGRPIRGSVTQPTGSSETMVRETCREEQQREAELWREQLLHDQREARGLVAAVMKHLPQQLARAVLAFAETENGAKLIGYELYDSRRVRNRRHLRGGNVRSTRRNGVIP